MKSTSYPQMVYVFNCDFHIVCWCMISTGYHIMVYVFKCKFPMVCWCNTQTKNQICWKGLLSFHHIGLNLYKIWVASVWCCLSRFVLPGNTPQYLCQIKSEPHKIVSVCQDWFPELITFIHFFLFSQAVFQNGQNVSENGQNSTFLPLVAKICNLGIKVTK